MGFTAENGTKETTDSKPMRDKYWSELDSNEEKIERIRPVIVSSQNRIERLEKALHHLTEQLNAHSHLPNGTPAVPLGNEPPRYYKAGFDEPDQDKVYI